MRVQVVAGVSFLAVVLRVWTKADDLGRPASPMPVTAVAYKMRNRCLLMSILALASSAMLATSTFAAEAGATEHEGVSLKPQMLVQFGGFGITNSMLVTWIVAAGIIVFHKSQPGGLRPSPAGFKIFGSG